MEKRLFLAVFLSLGIVFIFQWFVAPTTKVQQNVEQQKKIETENNQKVENSTDIVSSSVNIKKPDTSVLFNEEKLVMEQQHLLVEVSNKGGNIEKIEDIVLKHSFQEKHYFSFTAFDQQKFDLKKINTSTIQASFKNQEFEIIKTYTIRQQNALDINVSIKNISNSKKSFTDQIQAMVVDLSRLDINEKQADWTLREYVIKTNKKMIRKNNVQQLNDKWNKEEHIEVEWFGYRNKYFSSVVKPNFKVEKYIIKALDKEQLSLGTHVSYLDILPGDKIEMNMLVYVGPQTPSLLKAVDASFEKIFVFSDWGWLDAISKAIYFLLGFLHNILPIWGLCIILVSLIIYGLMYPLTLKSLISMKKIQKLQPKIKTIQEKYKNNPEKLNQEIVQLYKTENVNPLSGCLPMLLQMPIFVGLYQVLWRTVYFRGESFLWIKDLSMPDHLIKLPVNVPLMGEYINILPIIMMIVMGIQQKLSMASLNVDSEQAQQQKMMAIIFPIVIGVIFYQFASGLNLYFVVFYILSAITQWKISKA